jgi:hypothetical protein
MVRKRLSLALLLLTLVPGACTSRTVPTPTIVQTGTLGGVKPTATITPDTISDHLSALARRAHDNLDPGRVTPPGQPHPTETPTRQPGEPAGPATFLERFAIR